MILIHENIHVLIFFIRLYSYHFLSLSLSYNLKVTHAILSDVKHIHYTYKPLKMCLNIPIWKYVYVYK